MNLEIINGLLDNDPTNKDLKTRIIAYNSTLTRPKLRITDLDINKMRAKTKDLLTYFIEEKKNRKEAYDKDLEIYNKQTDVYYKIIKKINNTIELGKRGLLSDNIELIENKIEEIENYNKKRFLVEEEIKN